MIKASQIIELAQAQIGTSETTLNNIKYNTEYYGGQVYGTGYGWNTVFVWWLFKALGASSLFFGGNKTSRAIYVYRYYVEFKDFYKDPSEFRVGDILAMKTTQTTEEVDHVAIIETVEMESETVYVIIGDSNNTVERKAVHFSNIVGACRPAYIDEDEGEYPADGEIIDVPTVDPDETPSDSEAPEEPPEEPPAGNEPTEDDTVNDDSSFIDVIEKPLLDPVIKLPDSADADLNLVAISATKKIYSEFDEPIKVGRTFLAIRMTNGLGDPAVGRLNINGYEFVFPGAVRIPEKYIKTGINDLTFFSADGNIYTAHSFIKNGSTITPIPAIQSDLIEIARSYEKVSEKSSALETRIFKLEKATEGIDLADIVLSEEGLGELTEALEKIANTPDNPDPDISESEGTEPEDPGIEVPDNTEEITEDIAQSTEPTDTNTENTEEV